MEIIQKSRFLKDIKKIKKQNKKLDKLKNVIETLVSKKKLPDKLKPHPLIGDWRPCWDIHIEPDWLLIYYLDKEADQLTLYRTGSHADLF
ncbi:MAG: type II toxin-antitoxin system mRNA interferase toxin, RelE/StbE family [Alphaproteobacteria bacterium]|nr:MAG: type II toxin-antitoxin system mRNA interferase toxin, RelE/StbE family [Alphaproteobacteria bacterium]